MYSYKIDFKGMFTRGALFEKNSLVAFVIFK